VPEPEVHLAADILVPDWAGWRRERMNAIPKGAYFELAPDWVCEILSPSTARIDRVRKLPVYAREGVKHAWLIDPRARTLEVFRLEAGRWLLLATHAEDEVVRIEPFDAIEFNLATLWADLTPTDEP
jgi:Uma2 family endonuclease